MNSTVRKTIIFFSIIFIPFIVVITCPLIGYMGYLVFDGLFKDSGPSIEKNGLEGCDTIPFAGDKEQLAEAFMANVDAIWTELNKNDVNLDSTDIYAHDPVRYYARLCLKTYERDGKYYRECLPIYPSKYYKAFTDMVLYSKDKQLCMAFIVIRDDLYKGTDEKPPYFKTYVVIGKREQVNKPFKIFVRNDEFYYVDSNVSSYKKIKLLEERILYVNGATFKKFDVYPPNNFGSLPVLSDPDFFEKHPLFDKYDDSTYNFEWYRTPVYNWNEPKETLVKYYRYDYPYIHIDKTMNSDN